MDQDQPTTGPGGAGALGSLLPQAVALSVGVAAAAFTVGRWIQRERMRAVNERESLRTATEKLRHRNNQLNALYNVFSEITETLSLRYVVEATVRETLRLMDGEGVVLWLIRGSELAPIGSLTRAGKPVRGLEAQVLGEGLMGRTAKRGRTLRIDDDNIEMLTDAQRAQGLRSGILVPLIVGARVVGLLNCWSTKSNAFNDEDQRILEMMASQVATAVVAADTTDTSERRAHHDALTGLPNRLQLAEDLAGELATSHLGERRGVVAMVDIDHFKRFNDDYGHSVGDVTLQKVASLLQNCIRNMDRIYRYGGEEFVVIFMDATLGEAEALAERLRKATETTPFSGSSLEPVGPVTISIGLAARPEQGTEIEALIDLADKAMYEAKESGRNRVVLWRAAVPKPVRRTRRAAA
ncbi:MAG TPA: sensor domain-containing diguanylate cyclase [Dehalococcoidia bacterium]|jgi:diguanylate cyclase (GGDEF)-like protein|nr:sensor domain-containing diguanylate cyclase [Dehalococcoidia bacterium]